MFRYRSLVALLSLLATGCTFNLAPVHEGYPAKWQQLRPASSSSCQDFVGTYDAIGERARSLPNGANTPRLLSIVGLIRTADAAYASLQAAYVSIRVAQDGSAHMMALNSAKQPIIIAGMSEPMSCSGGNLARDFTRSNYADGNSHESRSHVTLSLTLDSALVVHVTGASNTSDLLSDSKQNYDLLYRFTRSP